MKKRYLSIVLLSAFIPSYAFAAITDFHDLMQKFVDLLTDGIKLLFALAFCTFFWGIVKFILNTDDDKARAEGKSWMMWSVIALFVMVSLWGIVGILINTFGIGTNVIPQL